MGNNSVQSNTLDVRNLLVLSVGIIGILVSMWSMLLVGDVFDSIGIELPDFTKLMVSVSVHFFSNFAYALIALLAVFLCRYYGIRLRMPMCGYEILLAVLAALGLLQSLAIFIPLLDLLQHVPK